MPNKKTKMINRVKKAIAPLKPVLLKDIPRPQTVEEGRANLRRFYGCVDGNLMVLLNTTDKRGDRINFHNGDRVNGIWTPWYSEDSHLPEPHSAIQRITELGSYFYVSVDPDKMNSFSDLYKITNTGCISWAYDPSFTMNLIIGREHPILENTKDSFWEMYSVIQECEEKEGERGDIDSWLYDPTAYKLFSNDDPALHSHSGFYVYSIEKEFQRQWRQMNNLEMRYLHYLLLGPFAPYGFVSASEEIAA